MLQVRALPPESDGTPACLLPVKAVPGARREAIAGVLGGRLKVRVCAPPEGGRANRAICAAVAAALGLRGSAVTVHSGASSPEKVLHIRGLDAPGVARRWPG